MARREPERREHAAPAPPGTPIPSRSVRSRAWPRGAGLLLGLFWLAATPSASGHAQDALPSVGTTVVSDGWQVTLDSYGIPPAADPGLPPPRGTQFLAAFTVTDLQGQGSPCTEDIHIASADGQRYTPLTIDQTPGPPRVVRGPGAPEPPPQLRYCVTDAVFEIDPGASDLTLNVLGVTFQLPR